MKDASKWTNARLVAIALITAIVGSVVSPLTVAYIAGKQKEQDFERQDKVAETLRLENERRTAAEKDMRAKLDIIHTLVNSNLTAAMQAEFDARNAEFITLVELTDLKRASGKQPSQGTLERIAATKAKIGELRATLDNRQREQVTQDEIARIKAKKETP